MVRTHGESARDVDPPVIEMYAELCVECRPVEHERLLKMAINNSLTLVEVESTRKAPPPVRAVVT